MEKTYYTNFGGALFFCKDLKSKGRITSSVMIPISLKKISIVVKYMMNPAITCRFVIRSMMKKSASEW